MEPAEKSGELNISEIEESVGSATDVTPRDKMRLTLAFVLLGGIWIFRSCEATDPEHGKPVTALG